MSPALRDPGTSGWPGSGDADSGGTRGRGAFRGVLAPRGAVGGTAGCAGAGDAMVTDGAGGTGLARHRDVPPVAGGGTGLAWGVVSPGLGGSWWWHWVGIGHHVHQGIGVWVVAPSWHRDGLGHRVPRAGGLGVTTLAQLLPSSCGSRCHRHLLPSLPWDGGGGGHSRCHRGGGRAVTSPRVPPACNVTIHNRCKDTLPNCTKVKQKVSPGPAGDTGGGLGRGGWGR